MPQTKRFKVLLEKDANSEATGILLPFSVEKFFRRSELLLYAAKGKIRRSVKGASPQKAQRGERLNLIARRRGLTPQSR